MKQVKSVVCGAGRVAKAVLLMKWEPVPFFGAGLVAVWLWWIALAFSK